MWRRVAACGMIAAAVGLLFFSRRCSPVPVEPPVEPPVEAAEEEAPMEEVSDEQHEDEDETWISSFVGENIFFVEVDEEFIRSGDGNLAGLADIIPMYKEGLATILGEMPEEKIPDEEHEWVFGRAAEMLYGLIHARYILTSRGMTKMLDKYNVGAFGVCPRIKCVGQNVLPVGLADLPREGTAAVFCPKCQDTFTPDVGELANFDGAYFGTDFSDMFLKENPDLR